MTTRRPPLVAPLVTAWKNVCFPVKLASRLGPWNAFRFFWARLRGRDILTLHPRLLRHPVRLRVRSTDLDVFYQVIRRREYAAAGPPVPPCPGPLVIVDGGANAGYTSAYFLSRYPRAQVVAIEPCPANAALCRLNLAPYGDRATVIEAALWSRPARLRLHSEPGDEWATRVSLRDTGGDVDGITLGSLGLGRIDILKLDIEGAEAELFTAANDWLPLASTIVVELHGPACDRAMRAALAGYTFDESRSGELTLCRNLQPKAR